MGTESLTIRQHLSLLVKSSLHTDSSHVKRWETRVPHCRIDHITVTAPMLEACAEFVRQTLGVAPHTGGEHLRMGTHNLLLRLGDSLFLEVISPNPKAPVPTRPRWFALDTLRSNSAPALSTWVVRTLHTWSHTSIRRRSCVFYKWTRIAYVSDFKIQRVCD